jgi:hypothetical protein
VEGLGRMRHTVYRTVNLINGKFYIGVHKTDNPNDEYLGSGTYIQRAVQKYGASSFVKEILFEFTTQEEAWVKENELVELFRKDPLCMNQRKGGSGGYDFINQLPSIRQIKSEAGKLGGRKSQEIFRKAIPTGNPVPWFTSDWAGKKHSESTKTRMSESKRGTLLGEDNPQFGTCWVNNGEEEKAIRGDVPEGWSRGRLMVSKSLVCQVCESSFQSIRFAKFCSRKCRRRGFKLRVSSSAGERQLCKLDVGGSIPS